MRPRADLERLAGRLPAAGAVVAELEFAFWQHLFVVAQDPRLWDKHLRTAFPGILSRLTVPQAGERIHDRIQIVRDVRNRIAHHEPTFTRDLATDLDAAMKLIEWRRPSMAAWITDIEIVTDLLASRP